MIALLAAAAALAVIGYIVLPGELAMQLGAGGEKANVMRKPVALLIPFLLTSVFAVLYGNAGDRHDQWKYFVISLLGLLAYAFTFVVNLWVA